MKSIKQNSIQVLVLIIVTVAQFATSCVPQKKLVYLQSQNRSSDTTETLKYSRTEYKLQVNDILDVQIRSMNPEVNEIFSSSDGGAARMTAQVGAQNGGDLYYMTGYSINDSGYINLPIIGQVDVTGKTVQEAQDKIKEEVEKYFSKYYLTVKLGGIRYSALGEFVRPGKYVLLQNQATIFEAIANAGDLSIVAERSKLKLIRQFPEGTKVFDINLLDKNIISSPFYFIQPNDVIYAEPLKQKSFGIGVTGAQTITTIVSIVSTSLALILAIQSLNN